MEYLQLCLSFTLSCENFSLQKQNTAPLLGFLSKFFHFQPDFLVSIFPTIKLTLPTIPLIFQISFLIKVSDFSFSFLKETERGFGFVLFYFIFFPLPLRVGIRLFWVKLANPGLERRLFLVCFCFIVGVLNSYCYDNRENVLTFELTAETGVIEVRSP